jgi:ABC-2 type transport system ATP-binding protein
MESLISFQNLRFSYPNQPGGFHLDISDLQIQQGSIFALLGPNGAGKTTLLRIITGLLKPESSGPVFSPLVSCDSKTPNRKAMGVLIENPGVYGRLSIIEYLRFFASFYEVKNPDQKILEYCEGFDLRDCKMRMAQLSLGMKQKVHLIRTLIHDPALVLLDEPASNLDPVSRQQVWELIRQKNQNAGTTFVICSHILPEAGEHCSHGAFIKSGSLLKSGTLDELLQQSEATEVIIRFEGDVQTVATLTQSLPHVQLSPGCLVYSTTDAKKQNPELIAKLQNAGVQVWEVQLLRPDLQKVYQRLMQAES